MGKGFAFNTVGGDARTRGGLALGAVAHSGAVLEKPAGKPKKPAGESIHRGGGTGLGSGGKEKSDAPDTKVVGESIHRGGGVGLGTGGKEKPDGPQTAVTPGADHYADPGYQADGKLRYPLDTEAHVRAAMSYFARPGNFGRYTEAQRKVIGGKIAAAAKSFNIDRYENATRK